MTHQIISTEKAPKALGPYSQATVYNGAVYCAGQIGIVPETMNFISKTDVALQTRQCLLNLENVLKAANSDFSKVLKVNVYLKSLGDFDAVNKVYSEFFQTNPPARVCLEVSRLPKDSLVEIDCIAYV